MKPSLQAVLSLIEGRGSLDTREAKSLGIRHLAERIRELREIGVVIHTEMTFPPGSTNRRKRYAVYTLTNPPL